MGGWSPGWASQGGGRVQPNGCGCLDLGQLFCSDADPSSPIGLARAYFGARGEYPLAPR